MAAKGGSTEIFGSPEDADDVCTQKRKTFNIPKETLKFLKMVKKKKKIKKQTTETPEKEPASEIQLIIKKEKIDNHGSPTEKPDKQVVEKSTEEKSTLPALSVVNFPAHFMPDQERKKGEPSVRSVLYKYSQHSEKGWYICPRDGCKFKSRHSKNVYTHEKTHTGERKYCCAICGKTFVLMKNYKLHQAVHKDIRNFACSNCNKRFRSKHNLDRHILTHSNEKPFKCEEEGCTYAFRDKVNLKKHIALKHKEEKPFVCEVAGCEYVAFDRSSLKRHAVKHKDLRDRPSEMCSICGKTLYGSRSMQSHMLIHEGQTFQCPHCVYSTVFKQALIAHSMRKHGMDLDGNKVERTFCCSICEFSTFWEHDLKFHMAKHGSHRPFKCPICDYCTVLKGSLQKHMRLHTGEQPFTCQLCGKSYTNQSGLARHRRAHSGEKPHKCDICGNKYADLKTLRVHRYSHLNMKPFMCHLCNYTCTKKEVLVTHFQRVHGEGNIPEQIRPRPSARVIMRVTSGQTADEIVHNIAPPGFGERQFMIINEDTYDEKFMVIHEDETDLPIIEPSASELIPQESVFRIVQTEDGQTTVDTMNKIELPKDELEAADLSHVVEKQALKVMKIATALKSPLKTPKLHMTIDQAKSTPSSNIISEQNTEYEYQPAGSPKFKLNTNMEGISMTVRGQMASSGTLGQNFVIVSGEEANILKTLEGQPQLIAIPVSQDNNDAQNGALTLQNLIMETGTVDAELSNVLAAVKAGNVRTSEEQIEPQMEPLIQVTHPILQSQLKKEDNGFHVLDSATFGNLNEIKRIEDSKQIVSGYEQSKASEQSHQYIESIELCAVKTDESYSEKNCASGSETVNSDVK